MSSLVKFAVDELQALVDHLKIGHEAIAKVQDIIDELSSSDYLLIEWSVDDVQQAARMKHELEDSEIEPLSLEDAREVLSLLDKTHDCNDGITWEHIQVAIETLNCEIRRTIC